MLRRRKDGKKAPARALDQRVTTTVLDFTERTGKLAIVSGLRILPRGRMFPFDSFLIEDKIKRILIIGAEQGCDIVIQDKTISGLHCLIERHDHLLLIHDCESKNGTRINGALVKVGELTPGTLLSVGQTTMVAYGPDATEDRVIIAAASLDEFLAHAVEAHGSVRGAAEAIGLPYSTLRGWLRDRDIQSPIMRARAERRSERAAGQRAARKDGRARQPSTRSAEDPDGVTP